MMWKMLLHLHVNQNPMMMTQQSKHTGIFWMAQHMFWLRNKKNYFHVGTIIWGPTDLLGSLLHTFKCTPDYIFHGSNSRLPKCITDEKADNICLEWHQNGSDKLTVCPRISDLLEVGDILSVQNVEQSHLHNTDTSFVV